MGRGTANSGKTPCAGSCRILPLVWRDPRIERGASNTNKEQGGHMSGDFTIIIKNRVRFGDLKKDSSEIDHDSDADLLGLSATFPFVCPGIDSSKQAVLQFAHRGSTQGLIFPVPQPDGGLDQITAEHSVKINGVQLAGGIPASPVRGHMSLWSTRLLLIPPHVLRRENDLHIQTSAEATPGNLDNFTLDNLVVFFKTRPFIRIPVDVSDQLEENPG
jgi:hypothetical protein